MIELVDIIGVSGSIIREALQTNFSDFEDAIQAVSADYVKVDYILTRNQKDFTNAAQKVMSPSEFLNRI